MAWPPGRDAEDPAARMRVLLTFDATVGRRHLHDSFGRVRLARTLGPPRERESLELSGQRGVELHPALRRAGGPPEPPGAAYLSSFVSFIARITRQNNQ